MAVAFLRFARAARPQRRMIRQQSRNHSIRWASQTTAAQSVPRRAHVDDGLQLEDFINMPPATKQAGNTSSGATKPKKKKFEPKPRWLKAEVPSGENYQHLKDTVRSLGLATVCEEARCPNIGECWGGAKGTATATIMLMGDTCTRGCRFCSVKTSKAPPPLDPEEPAKVSKAILDWGLDYVVLTSVDRDDVADGGAQHIAQTVRHLKAHEPSPFVECLTPDFQGNMEHVAVVADSGLDVFAHNVETVEPLQRFVRDRRAGYWQSLKVLEFVKARHPHMITKSSIMLGCGETADEVRTTMQDLLNSGVSVLTLGQYLRPTKRHMKVAEYVTPEVFEQWKEEGEAMGFLFVASGPLVRSSYRAGELFLKHALHARQQQGGEHLPITPEVVSTAKAQATPAS